MPNFLFALQFLTIISLPGNNPPHQKGLSSSLTYFPLVGILLGLIMAGLNILLLSFSASSILAGAILTVFLTILSGGLHLDGLADTLDALLSGKKEREKLLEILREPHIGTMGALGITCVIVLKFALLCSLGPGERNSALVLTCFLSRTSLILPLCLFNYARSEGKAKIFFGALTPGQSAQLGVLALLISVFISGKTGFLIFIAVTLFTYLFSASINKKLSGLTGDILGAIVELNEILILLLLCFATAGI